MADAYRESYEKHRKLIDGLREKIRKAFAAGKPPAQVTATPKDRDEGEKLAKAFTGRKWADVPLAALEANRPAFFTEEALRYYLPAYLVASLDFDNLGVRNRTVAALGTAAGIDAKKLKAFAGGFTPEQRAAVREFLKAMKTAFEHDFDESMPAIADSSAWNG